MKFGISQLRLVTAHLRSSWYGVLCWPTSVLALVIASFVVLDGVGRSAIDQHVQLLRHLDANVVLTGAAGPPFVTGLNRFPQRALQTARQCSGVASAAALRVERRQAYWHDPASGTAAPVSVLALEPAQRTLVLPGAEQAIAQPAGAWQRDR